ncbi:hypothetical protein N9769_08530 [Ascidiaceihabitans sp.]|nr:hypothetical protein [Ascidiaceihabitans sp.]
MKKVLLSSIAYLSLANGPALAGVYDECTESSTATSTLIVGGEDSGARTCSVTPSTLTFKLFEVGICSADAAVGTTTPMENDTCIAVFTSANGLDANLSKGGSIPLSPELTLDEGTYTHGYILVGTEAKITMSHTFSTVRSASNGKDDNDQAVKQTSPSADGVVCYTNGNPIGVDALNSVTCGATNGAQAASSFSQRIGEYADDFSYMAAPMAVAGSASVNTRIWVLNSSKVQASSDFNSNGNGDDFGSWKDAVGADATATSPYRPYNYAIQPLSPALVVSPTTSSISIKFNVTNATAFDFFGPTAANDHENCASCIQDVAFDGMKFAFTSE